MRLLIATFAAMVISAAAAMPAGAADVNVIGPRGGETKSISFGSLTSQFDVDAEYVIRGASGAQSVKRVQGISVGRLLSVIGADEVYSGLEVLRPDGARVRLSKIQLLADGPRPVIFAEGGQLVFLRPSYSGRDANAGDTVSVGGDLTLKQIDLGTLSVTAKASKTKVKAGELVTFTGTASGGGAGEEYEFSWVFKDGSRGSGASVSHCFKKRGTYEVLVAANTVGSDRTDADVVVVQVGDRVASKKKRAGGGTNDSAGAPSSGAADGDSGSGDLAATEPAQTGKKRKKKPASAVDPSLERVTGQVLLSGSTEPLTESSTLAARSGSQQPVESNSDGFGISTGVLAAIAAALLLAFGAALENGRFRRRPLAG